jgi:hypothetical protein
VYGLKHQKEKRSMDHFAGLDAAVKETSVCIVDDTGESVQMGHQRTPGPSQFLAGEHDQTGLNFPLIRSFRRCNSTDDLRSRDQAEANA